MKINRLFSVIALAALMLASCAKSGDVVMSESDAISFSGYSGRALSKAYADYSVDSGYHVYAYLGSNAYFNDTFVNNTAASTGTTSKTYYWPTSISSTNKMVFYAVAPKTTALTDKKVADFNASAGDVDLVVAKSAEYSASAASVSLQFKHALAKIASLTLSSKTGTGADGSATADYKYNVTSLKITGNTVGTCDISGSAPSWGSLKTSGDYSYISSNVSFKGDKTLKKESPVNAIIPQSVTISVTYSISYHDGTDSTTVFGPVTKTGALTVAAGNAYAISITLTNDNTPIVFNSSVSDWSSSSPTVEVDTYDEIRRALAEAADGATVKLTKNYSGECVKPIVIPDGKTLDINGHTLDASGSTCTTFIQVGDGSASTKTASLFLHGKVTFAGSSTSTVVDLHTAKAKLYNAKGTSSSDWVNATNFLLSSGSVNRSVIKRSVSDDSETYFVYLVSTNTNVAPNCLIGTVSGLKKKQIYLMAYCLDAELWTTMTDLSGVSVYSTGNCKTFTANKTLHGVTFTTSMYYLESSGGPS